MTAAQRRAALEAADRALFRLRETVAACLVRVDGGQDPAATAIELRTALNDAWPRSEPPALSPATRR